MGVLAPMLRVIVEVPEPGAGIVLGLKLAVVPDGIPAAVSAIELLKPLVIAVVIVDVPWLPCATVRDVGEAEMVNDPRAGTVSE